MAKQQSPPFPIDFINLHDEEPDLIASFAITGTAGAESITLMRTPKFEVFEAASERGLRVYRDHNADPTSIVSRIALDERVISIDGSNSAYQLDVSSVEDAELRALIPILTKMNFDASFDLVL
jgi:hypothetical protein